LFPALICGNTAVLKPSQETPWTATLFVEILEEAGVPPGVVNLVHGTGPEVGAALVEHPDVALISFTGSTATGRTIAEACGGRLKRVQQYIEIGQAEGARLLLGGQPCAGDGGADGWFFSPTVFSGARPEMRIAREEIFGPVTTIIAVYDLTDAIRVLNGTRYG